MRFLLTGATGMIGVQIATLAVSLGHDVLCIVHRGTERAKKLPSSPHLSLLEADLSDYSHLERLGSFDCCIHLAWEKTFGASRDDVDVQVANIQYTLDAVRLAKRCGCTVFIGAGSQAEYGVVDSPLTPNTPTHPESGYGIAKLSAGYFSRLLCRQLGMRFNWMRILSVYGINDAPHTLIMYAISELLAGRSPEFTPCEQIWDYCNVKDVARAFLMVASKGVEGRTYPLGSGKGQPLCDYLKIIQKCINPTLALGFGKKPYYPHQPMYLVADISSLQADTGWSPEISFQQGIQEVITSFSVSGKGSC